ncbi:MAG: hypothetical protein R2753_04340 [Chitinophagales bacterium]
MKLIRFGRNKRQKALRQKLMRHYLIALISLLSFKEIKAQELPFAEPIIEPFNIYQNGYGQNWDSVTLQYFFIDIDLDGLKDLFFIDFICNEYPQFQGIYYQKNKLLESGNFSELLPIPSSFQEIYFSPTSKLTDLEEDGDLDIVRTRNYNLGYTADADMFEYVPNLSNKIDSFNFGDYVSVEEVCYSNHVGDVVNSCYNRMSIGDIDDDGDVDVLFTNLRTFYNRYLGYEVDRILDFPFFERNENTTDLLFNEPLVNPYNFEAIVNSLKLDSSFILESYISDINLDGKNDISMLSVTVNSDSISGLLNYKYQIKSFYKLSNNPTTFSENGQVIWSFKDSYTFDPALYDYYSFDTIGLFDGSFLKQSNIELIDLDNDGDQDLFFREVNYHFSVDYKL